MPLVTKAEVREHIETDLGDDALDRLIDDADAEIIRMHGEHTTQTEQLLGGNVFLILSRPASSITTVTEILKGTLPDSETTLSADDYDLWPDGRRLERLGDGTNQRETWGDVIEITYTPTDETAQRTRAEIDLVKLAIEYKGLNSEGIGDHKVSFVDYEDERSKILQRLGRLNFA